MCVYKVSVVTPMFTQRCLHLCVTVKRMNCRCNYQLCDVLLCVCVFIYIYIYIICCSCSDSPVISNINDGQLWQASTSVFSVFHSIREVFLQLLTSACQKGHLFTSRIVDECGADGVWGTHVDEVEVLSWEGR